MKTLSNGYTYLDAGIDSKHIFKSASCSSIDCLVVKTLQKSVYGTVVKYDYDSKFILVKQKPNFKVNRSMIKFEIEGFYLENANRFIYSEKESAILADSLLKNLPYYKEVFKREYNYWIISHKQDSLFGPLTKSEYLQKRKELGVPKSLQLD